MARFRNSSSSSHRTATRDPAPISEFLTDSAQPRRRQPTVQLPLPGHRKRSAQWWSEGLVLKTKDGHSGKPPRQTTPPPPAERASLTPAAPRDSLVPVVTPDDRASEEPTPVKLSSEAEKELTSEDLAVLPRRSPSARIYVAVAALGLLVAGGVLVQSRQSQVAQQPNSPPSDESAPANTSPQSAPLATPARSADPVGLPAAGDPASRLATDTAATEGSAVQQTTSALRPTPSEAPPSSPQATPPSSTSGGGDELRRTPANGNSSAAPQTPSRELPSDSSSSLPAPLVPSGTARASFPELPADTARNLQSTRPPLARSESAAAQSAASAGFTVAPKATEVAR